MSRPAAAWLRFDPLRRAGSPRLKAAVRSLVAFLADCEDTLGLRQRRRKHDAAASFTCAVETIATNLAWASTDPLSRPLAVPRGAPALRGLSRYKPACYGRGFLDALDLMAHPHVALIENGGRGYRHANGDAAPSLIRPTAAFLARFVPEAVTWRDFRREAEPEVLVLKAPKAGGAETSERMEYDDDTRTRHLRREVQQINRFLAAAPVHFVEDAGPLGLAGDGQLIDPLRRTLWRGFSNGSWDEGGRLWGGVWENMRRVDRFRLLRLGSAACPAGERVCNVDFRALYPTLAYHAAGLPAPKGDLYDVRGDGSDRAGFKSLIGAALFATRRFSQMPGDVAELFPPGTRVGGVVAAVERFHAPIAHLFWTGAGHRLAHAESTILIAALETLRRQSVVALPLHDSVIVAVSEAERARDALLAAFADHFRGHFQGAVSIDFD